MKISPLITPLLTLLTLCFFALNSIWCRTALKTTEIDAYSFAMLRVLSGTVVLGLIVFFRYRRSVRLSGPIAPSVSLAAYLLGFTIAYRELSTATGALILFGTVQATMIGVSLIKGEVLNSRKVAGCILALAGLIYLLFPGVESPSVLHAGLMIVAGIGWGTYSLLGRGSDHPLEDTASNFFRAMLICLIFFILGFQNISFSKEGTVYALLSGGIASGIGYAIWYTVLPKLSRMQAAIVQLFVPCIAALGGVLLLDEAFPARLGIAFSLTLGGILMVLFRR